MLKHLVAVAFGLLLALPAAAQIPVPVSPLADWASYGTAAINPTMAAVEVWRSPQRGCRFAQLAISEAVGNGVALTLKHFIVSPRPCIGCTPDGMPSGHTMNSIIGVSASWRVGMLFAVGTGGLRMAAHRHTLWQVAAGAALGVGAEATGRLLKCQDSR